MDLLSTTLSKGDWKRRFKATAKSMKYKVLAGVDDCWDVEVQPQLKAIKKSSASRSSPTITSSTSATESKKKINDEDKARVVKLYDTVKEEDKWTLSNGTVVNDRMKELVIESVYEHPVHSFIINCSDPIWTKYSTEEELIEIKTFKLKKLSALPEDLASYLNLYESLQSTSDIQ